MLAAVATGTRRYWKTCLTIFVVVSVLGALYAFLSPVIYRAQAVLVPVTQTGDASGLLASLGPIGGLVSQGGQVTRKTEALALLRSRQFTESFIERHQLRPILFPQFFDAGAATWYPEKEPTLYQAYEFFASKVRRIEENLTEATVTVAIEWDDPELAAIWANQLVRDLNQSMRQRAISEYDATLEYLHNELSETTELGLKQALYSVIEENIRAAALANVQVQFAFRTIDKAAPPDADAHHRPHRLAIILASMLLGMILGIFFALSRELTTGGKLSNQSN